MGQCEGTVWREEQQPGHGQDKLEHHAGAPRFQSVRWTVSTNCFTQTQQKLLLLIFTFSMFLARAADLGNE